MKKLGVLVIIATVCALVAHFGIFYFLGIRAPALRPPVPQRFIVRYLNNDSASPDSVALQQGILLDSAPLFMPTRWNLASRMSEVASLQKATEVFSPFPPDLDLPDSRPSRPFATPTIEDIATPALAEEPTLLLARYGRQAHRIPVSHSPFPKVSATRLDRVDTIPTLTVSLPEDLYQGAPPALWNPVRFYLHIDEDVPVGAPLLVQSSGFADWDQVLQSFVGSLQFYGSIGSGYYRISVYP